MKYMLILLLSLSLAQSIRATQNFSLNEEQKTVLKEYRLDQLEKHKEKGKQFRAICIKLLPEYAAHLLAYEILIKMFSGTDIYIFEELSAAEDIIFSAIDNHPELQNAMQPYYNESKCRECFAAGFDTIFSWDHFKLFYALGSAGVSQDQNIKNMLKEIGQQEMAAFADQLIRLKQQ